MSDRLMNTSSLDPQHLTLNTCALVALLALCPAPAPAVLPTATPRSAGVADLEHYSITERECDAVAYSDADPDTDACPHHHPHAHANARPDIDTHAQPYSDADGYRLQTVRRLVRPLDRADLFSQRPAL